MKEMSDKQCFTIGETAEILGESTSAVRFWSNRFSRIVRPVRNEKGNRLYSRSDIEVLKKIHYYIRERGMTLDGVGKLINDNASGTDNRAEVVERLRNVRAVLETIREKL